MFAVRVSAGLARTHRVWRALCVVCAVGAVMTGAVMAADAGPRGGVPGPGSSTVMVRVVPASR